jgi:signal transduction histidine kinase
LEQRVVERTAVAEHRASQLRLLAAELTQAEERERQRVARLLHDQVQQLLVAGRIKLAAMRRQSPSDRLLSMLEEADGLLNEAIEESRLLTASLSPPILYERGLRDSLQWLVRHVRDNLHLTVDLQVEAEADPLEQSTRVLLFHAARELLLNTAKHAQTSRATVAVSLQDHDRLRLIVSDDGVGFDPARLLGRSTPSGFGLFSIRERVELIGGRMEVTSASGQGTRVTIEVPRGRGR